MSVQKWIVKEVAFRSQMLPILYQTNSVKPYLNLPCRLGEGPFYEEKSHSLRFIDIWVRMVMLPPLLLG